jgi:hypothetical protein
MRDFGTYAFDGVDEGVAGLFHGSKEVNDDVVLTVEGSVFLELVRDLEMS